MKKDIKAFLTVNGFLRVLNTKSAFKNVFCLFYVVILLIACLFYITMSFLNFYQYDVVTQIKTKEVETLTFPAITLCLVVYNYTVNLNQQPYFTEQFGTRLLSEILLTCNFEDKECSIGDFEHFTVYFQYEAIESHLNCYKFNGGKNASKHHTEILKSRQFGGFSGLILQIHMSKRDFMFYHIGENHIQPRFSELTKTVQSGKNVFVAIKKTIDIKLPEPYSRCKDDINPTTSHLVKEILAQNITYRKTHCYYICLRKYASARNITLRDAYKMRFDYPGNCSQYCPLFLWINFFYNDNHYTEITQSIKTTVADLVSNNGGLLGLFLDLNFMSSIRMITDAFNVFF